MGTFKFSIRMLVKDYKKEFILWNYSEHSHNTEKTNL